MCPELRCRRGPFRYTWHFSSQYNQVRYTELAKQFNPASNSAAYAKLLSVRWFYITTIRIGKTCKIPILHHLPNSSHVRQCATR